ncbi:MAG: hypothetical protein HYW78_03600 [Parcubacteria group bacterium]|nr:hypothetical protein [Parcubacteria group bacterium]
MSLFFLPKKIVFFFLLLIGVGILIGFTIKIFFLEAISIKNVQDPGSPIGTDAASKGYVDGKAIWQGSTSSNIYVSSVGSVGIGTTAPVGKLDVQGGIVMETVPQRGIVNQLIPHNNIITTVESTGNIGNFSALTIGVDGLPVIAHLYLSNGLKVTQCGNMTCSSILASTIVDSSANAGYFNSIAIGTDGFPVISYQDIGANTLKVAKCGNAACSSGNIVTAIGTADENLQGDLQTSIAIGTDGFPVVSYFDGSSGVDTLKVAKCGDINCDNSPVNTITSIAKLSGETGTSRYSSLSIGADGLPIIVYNILTSSLYNLDVVKCGNAACSSGNTITTIDTNAGNTSYTAISIGDDGLPIIIYNDNSVLKTIKCGNASCSSGNSASTIDAEGAADTPSIAIGADGLPIVAYTISGGSKVVRCGNTSCSSGNNTVTIGSSNIGYRNSIAIGSDGLPIISNRDAAVQDLIVVKCGSSNCVPYWTYR